MAAVVNASAAADGMEMSTSEDEIRRQYTFLKNCDPNTDIIMAEHQGALVGYGRVWWQDENSGTRVYRTTGFVIPGFRRRGIGSAILRWQERRLRAIASAHPATIPRTLMDYARDTQLGLIALLAKAGYRPVRYFWNMVRPSLEDIPDAPLPPGFEVRPARPEHYRAIWDAAHEAMREHWGYAPPGEDDYQRWLSETSVFQPDLWQVAWHAESGEIAGQVRTYIDHEENRRFGRLRGYTEDIRVAQPYRRRGLARALMALSLRAQRAAGMSESALGVDSENATGATYLYESMGFRVATTDIAYEKPF